MCRVQILPGGPLRSNWPSESISTRPLSAKLRRVPLSLFLSSPSFLLPLSFEKKREGTIQSDEKINLTELVRKRVVELRFLSSFHLGCFRKINRIHRIVLFVLKIVGKIDINGSNRRPGKRSRRWICKNVDVFLET